jgi:hypothetical protein
MVRRADRPLRSVRVSFETTRFSAQHLVDAYAQLVTVRRTRLRPAPQENRVWRASPVKKRRGEP